MPRRVGPQTYELEGVQLLGEVAEWLKALVLKTSVG